MCLGYEADLEVSVWVGVLVITWELENGVLRVDISVTGECHQFVRWL